MKYSNFKSLRNQYIYIKQHEIFKLQLNSLFLMFWNKNFLFTFFLKQFFLKDLSSQIKIKNFCLESGGVKNLNKNLGLSRIKVRELTTLKLFSGLKKISW